MSGQHFLVVLPFDPESDDWYEVEHADDCPVFTRLAPDYPVEEYGCDVGFYLDTEGISSYWRHADDPDYDWPEPLKPGRYEIEAWSHRSPGGPWGPEEWDGGLRVVEAS